jgi:4-hydroxymandelate oxidase
MHPVLAAQLDAARRRLPPEAFAYIAAGAGLELTTSEAEAAWSRYRLRPRVLRDVATVDVATTLLGQSVASPIAVAPTAFHTLAHLDGETATAQGAAVAGSLFVLSARSTRRIEDVAAVAGPWWFQVYVTRDRGITRALVERAVAAGARALVLTGDTPYVGTKYRSAAPPIGDDAALVNVRGYASDDRIWDAIDQDPSITLATVGWLAEISGLPVVVKGVLRADDARDCLAAGAAGVIVSNHGGRQTDRSVATAQALPEVVDAVGAEVEVYVDGGIRSGVDALVALGLGARAVFVGRPVLYGLAADGAAGVASALQALSSELTNVLAVAGFASLAGLTRDVVS